MNITVVMGFFLPMPPAAGGAVEKSWDGLATEFARRGHHVTLISRRWPDWPDREERDGVTYLRLPGFNHRRRLWQNLLLDFIWSWRVFFRLPHADVVVVNAVTLPCWLGWLRPSAGRVVVMPGRMPKGQFRCYSHVARVLATSTPVRACVLAERAHWEPLTRVSGYPIDWRALSAERSLRRGGQTVIGFVGRIHREKGIDLLLAALALLARRNDLPAWRVVICGPSDVSRGGSGEEYATSLQHTLAATLPSGFFEFRDPIFDESRLAALYREIDVFCYPSIAARGETFGVAVAEAMAAGAVPVVSNLPCFIDFVRDGVNGIVFDHATPDAIARLTVVLGDLVANPARRTVLSQAAQYDTRIYDFPQFASRLLDDFSTLK